MVGLGQVLLIRSCVMYESVRRGGGVWRKCLQWGFTGKVRHYNRYNRDSSNSPKPPTSITGRTSTQRWLGLTEQRGQWQSSLWLAHCVPKTATTGGCQSLRQGPPCCHATLSTVPRRRWWCEVAMTIRSITSLFLGALLEEVSPVPPEEPLVRASTHVSDGPMRQDSPVREGLRMLSRFHDRQLGTWPRVRRPTACGFLLAVLACRVQRNSAECKANRGVRAER